MNSLIKRIKEKPPLIAALIIGAILYATAFVFLPLLHLVDYYLMSKQTLLTATGVDNGFGTWFSFYGSILGAATTVALSMFTYHLSERIDLMDRISKISELNARSLLFYDFYRDYKPSVMPEEPNKGAFLFLLVF